MTTLFRIAVIGTKGAERRYVSGTADGVKITGREDALHWNKTEAKILCSAFNHAATAAGHAEQFQIEKA